MGIGPIWEINSPTPSSSLDRNDLVNLGIVKVGDLITDSTLFLHDPYAPISPEQRFFIMGVVHSLPSDWKTIIRPSVCINEINPSPSSLISPLRLFFAQKTNSSDSTTKINR